MQSCREVHNCPCVNVCFLCDDQQGATSVTANSSLFNEFCDREKDLLERGGHILDHGNLVTDKAVTRFPLYAHPNKIVS